MNESRESLLRKCQFSIRKLRSVYPQLLNYFEQCDFCRYLELCQQDSIQALAYLQSNVAALAQHGNEEECHEVRNVYVM